MPIILQKVQKSFTYYSAFENAVASKTLADVLKCGIEITKEIVAEILCSHPQLLQEISLHDQKHKVVLIKKIVFCFLTIKGKHLCRNVNVEENTLIRHTKTKEILFKHQ